MAAFREAERRYGLPPNILVRMAQQESNFDPNAVSPAGAVGLMQIVPKWHPTVDPRDPFASIDYAGRYLRQLYDRFGNWPEALAAYNWGPTVLERKGLDQAPRETRRYVAAIAGDLGLA
ncbi:MAG TPA: lytic transglycosylase domain-containing protein [Gammaproteobacteria bacterium]|nr:lytic transglycosylase domain-containing protein [Gammaproteobacteria bacterium]